MESQAYPENSAAEKLSTAIVLLALDAAAQVRKPLLPSLTLYRPRLAANVCNNNSTTPRRWRSHQILLPSPR